MSPVSGYRNVYSTRHGGTRLGPPWKSLTVAQEAATTATGYSASELDKWEGTYLLRDVSKDHREPGNVLKLHGPDEVAL
jgi:hypothetical protein